MNIFAQLVASLSLLAADVPAVPIEGLNPSVISADGGSVWQQKAGGTTQGFFAIHNEGGGPDVLTGWSCSIAATTTLADAAGKPMQDLPIPGNQSVVMVTKGPHLVLSNTYFDVSSGSLVPCTLTFKNDEPIGVMLNAVPMPAP